MEGMKIVVTYTCINCDALYDKEIDIGEEKAIKWFTANTMFIGVCTSCMKKDIDPGKAIDAFVKRHEDDLKDIKEVTI
jgi:hypothetical protein